MTMPSFFKRLFCPTADEVLYLQSQDNNLRNELSQLLEDATTGIPFATEVFGGPPEVANVWIGDERSVTSIHKGSGQSDKTRCQLNACVRACIDPYENLYLVVHGTKTFDLLPPTEFYCLHGESACSCC